MQRATRGQQCSELFSSSATNKLSREERGRVRGQETRALQTTYLNPEFLHETIREKDHSATFPSTSCSLRSPGLPLVPSWLSSAHALRPPAPRLSLAFRVPGHPEQGSGFLGSLTQWKPVDRVGERGSLRPVRCTLACSTCSASCFECSGVHFVHSTDRIPSFLKGKGLARVFISSSQSP